MSVETTVREAMLHQRRKIVYGTGIRKFRFGHSPHGKKHRDGNHGSHKSGTPKTPG